MRAITVRQPWAWAIVHGGKDVENRTRNVAGSYRGPVAIHAGLAERDPGFRDPTFGAAFLKATREAAMPEDLAEVCRGPLIRGAFVGVVDLVAVHWSVECCDLDGRYCSPWAQESYHVDGLARRRVDIAHLVLANPRPLPEPIPARGRLGLWTPGPDAAQRLAEIGGGS